LIFNTEISSVFNLEHSDSGAKFNHWKEDTLSSSDKYLQDR
jgi:hypothetical protein